MDRVLGPRILIADRINYARPQEFSLPAESVEIPLPRGGRLRGIWAPGPPRAPAVLFLPGNSGNLSGHLPYLEILHRAGLGAMGIDHRGFGESDGRPSLAALAGDALLALECLARLAGASAREGGGARDAGGAQDAGGATGRLGLFGVSLGANLALEAAGRSPLAGAVAVEGLSIQRELVRGIIARGTPGPLTVRRLREGGDPPRERTRHELRRAGRIEALVCRLAAGPCSWLAAATSPFGGQDPRATAARLGGRPALIIHGAEDRLLPFEAALLARRSVTGPARLWLIPGSGHAQEPALICPEEYAAQLGAFFREALSTGTLVEPQVSFNSGTESQQTIKVCGSPGPYLLAIVAGEELVFERLWVDGDRAANLTIEAAAPIEEVRAIRYIHARPEGATWSAEASERSECYARVGGPLREISSALIEGRLGEADRALAGIEREELPPPFDLARRLHRHRRALLAGRAPAILAAALALSLSLAGCATPPSPFPPIGPVSGEEAGRIHRERAGAARSLYAVVRVAMTSAEMSGTFDVACNFAAPRELRLSAFKDVLLGTRPIFDLVLSERRGRYRATIHGEGAPEKKSGRLGDLPADLPRMGSLYWLGPLLFLPGGLPRPGSTVVWEYDPVTLAIRSGELWRPGAARPIIVEYRDYRLVGGAIIPHRVRLSDRDGGLAMESMVRDLEVNPEIDPRTFDPEEP